MFKVIQTLSSVYKIEEASKHLPGLQEAAWPMAIHREDSHKKRAKKWFVDLTDRR